MSYIPEEPNKFLLRREEARALSEQHFSAALSTLRDMVGYGTHLVIRAYNSSSKDNESMVVIGVLLKQIVSMLDAVDILMREGHSYPALLQVRAAFEASLEIDWVLESDSENRARHYIVGNLRDEAMWAKRFIGGTPEKASFDAAVGVLKHEDPAKAEVDARGHLTQVERILSKPEFATIDSAFTQKRGSKQFDPAWYEILGVPSIRSMAKALGRLRDYELIYGRGSDAMHAGLYKDHLHFHRGGFRIRPLRNLSDAHSVFNFAMAIAAHSFQIVLKRYRREEHDQGAFAKRYVERWREAFLSVPQVVYKYS
jgi:hypothetical protein